MLIFSSLLDPSRALDRYALSTSVKDSLVAKGITSLTPLQEEAVDKFVGRPTCWYIERISGPNSPRTMEYIGDKKPENLKEDERAVEVVQFVKARQDMICLAETGEYISSLGT